MRRREKTGGKALKAQRRQTVRRPQCAKGRTPSRSATAKETSVAQLRRERDEALERETATADILRGSQAHRETPSRCSI